MRKKKLAKNTISSLILQISTIITGFILPKMILSYYGSNVNGLVNSIVQFLHIIAFLELGVGAVVQSSLYKPLAKKDDKEISKIIASANKFFKNIGRILLVYILFLVCFYNLLSNQDYGWIYTATLIISIGIGTFAQYYFGIVDRLLLTADQKGYIQYNAQTITLILNTIICGVLIWLGFSIHIVKITTSIIYLVRPFLLRLYVNKHYRIDRKIKYDKEPIKQKWNGIALHISSFILDGTDNIVLTIFSTLSNVSIYSVYHLVVYGVKYLFLSLTNGIQSLLGELWARKNKEKLEYVFSWTEWTIHTLIVIIFGCTGILIIPFVQVYVKGVTDVNYVQPLFSAIIVLAHAIHCLNQPYHIMIKTAGHYKETQNNYFISAIINIVISIITVKLWGLVGVAIGTLVAMTYQTVWMIYYNSKQLLCWPIKKTIKQLVIDFVIVIISVFVSQFIHIKTITYFSWILYSAKIILIWITVSTTINILFYKEKIIDLTKKDKLFNKEKS